MQYLYQIFRLGFSRNGGQRYAVVLYNGYHVETTLPDGKHVTDLQYNARIVIRGGFELRDDVRRWFPGKWGALPESVCAVKDLPAAQTVEYHEVFEDFTRPAHNLIARASNIADRKASV